MTAQVLTVVSATLSDEQASTLRGAYQDLLASPHPPGLLRSELVSGPGGYWAVHSLWLNKDMLDVLLSQLGPLPVPTLFRKLGVEPQLLICEVEISSVSSP